MESSIIVRTSSDFLTNSWVKEMIPDDDGDEVVNEHVSRITVITIVITVADSWYQYCQWDRNIKLTY